MMCMSVATSYAGGASAADYLTKWNGTTWTALLSGTAGETFSFAW
jgi:hypothetical protein